MIRSEINSAFESLQVPHMNGVGEAIHALNVG